MKSNNILIWGNNWIGDVVCSLPSVTAIKKANPDCTLTMVVRHPSQEIVRLINDVDHVFTFSKKDSLKKTIKFLLKLRMFRFDTAFIFPNSFRSALLTFLSGAKIRIGHKKQARNFLLTHSLFPPANKCIHLTDFFFNIVKSEVFTPINKEVALKIPRDDITFARSYIKQLRKDGFNGQIIIIHAGASKPPRSWNIEKFSDLLKKISKKGTYRFLAIGTPNELKRVEKLREELQKEILFAFEQFTLTQVCALMKECKIFIGNDSGMMHLASILGLHTVAVFGPDRPIRTGAFTNKDKFYPVSKYFPCSPCRQNFFKDCIASKNGKAPCIEAINTDDVFEVLKKIIN